MFLNSYGFVVMQKEKAYSSKRVLKKKVNIFLQIINFPLLGSTLNHSDLSLNQFEMNQSNSDKNRNR